MAAGPIKRWLERLRRGDSRKAGHSPVSEEIDDEIRTHLALRTEDLVDDGLDPDSARQEAVRRFGDLDEARRALCASAAQRDHVLRWSDRLDALRRDVTLALRRMRRAPGFTALAIATFALGIGLTTAMFSVVDHVLIRALPYPEPHRLVALLSVAEDGSEFPYVSSANWIDWKENSTSLEATALHSFPDRVGVAINGTSFRAPAVRVAGRFFDALGAPMLLGRAFTEEEAEQSAPLAVVSEGFWRRALAADPSFDREIYLAGSTRKIVGVVRSGTGYPGGIDVWLPTRARRGAGAARNNINYMAVARLHPDVSPAAARAELAPIADQIRASDPEGVYSWGVGVVPLRDLVVGGSSGYLLLLMGAVAFVMLVACANLAGLGFARGSARSHETALRSALGASRFRLVQQEVVEHLVLSFAGGGLGIAAAWLGTRALIDNSGAALPRAQEVAMDPRVLGIGVALSALAGLLAGITPALRTARTPPRVFMSSGGRTARGGRALPGSLLVAAEVALAVTLLIGAGLLLRSFNRLVSRELGFDPRGVVVADVDLNTPTYRGEPERWAGYWRRFLEEVGAMPGVEVAAAAYPVPTASGGRSWIEIEGGPETEAGADYRVVTPGYFEALRLPVIEGRTFDDGDRRGSGRVVLVNRSLAETHWPGASALGKRLRSIGMETTLGSPWLTVVGVVEDARYWGYEDEPAPAMYVAFEQVPGFGGAMIGVARGHPGGEAALATALRAKLAQLDSLAAADLSALVAELDAEVGEQRMVASVLGTFAALALALAAIGVYGLLSFSVVQRTREIAVRATVGAGSGSIVRMIVGDALRVAVAGAAVGLVAAFWLSFLLDSFLVEVGRHDLATFAGIPAVLLGVAVLAAALPATRASRLDILEALRRE